MGESILRLVGITKRFGDAEVLNGIDLEIQKGEFITLLGSSGCGKTTTLRIIAGLEQPDAGQVFLQGRDVTREEPNHRNVNTVFQNYALFPHMDVAANIGYSLRLRGQSRGKILEAVTHALELVQLEGYEKRMPGELSGGQRQRVAIARAIVASPAVLLLDEPLGALDLQLRRQMQLELKKLQTQLGITFIYITHDQEEALTMSDHIAIMRNGLFEQIGTPSEVYDRPKTSYVARFVGSANIFSGTVLSADQATLTAQGEGGVWHAARNGAAVAHGQTITIAVRRENLRLAIARDGETEGLRGTVTGKSFAGGLLQISIALPDGAELVASRYGIDGGVNVGDAVFANWLPEDAVLVDLEDSL